MKYHFLIIAVASLLLFGCATGKNHQSMQVVKDVDIERYMGTWYEIARFPHSFEKDLVGVTATYRLKNNGNVEVINQGFKHTLDGKKKRAQAFAKTPNTKNSGHLRVFFFWPFGADYLILDLDEDYTWALVGSSSPNFLWILSRTPQLPQETYNQIVSKAQELGYDTNKLLLVEQKTN